MRKSNEKFKKRRNVYENGTLRLYDTDRIKSGKSGTDRSCHSQCPDIGNMHCYKFEKRA